MMDRYALRRKLRRAAAWLEEGAKRAWYGTFMPLWRAQARRKRLDLCGNYVAVLGSCGKSTATMLLGELLKPQRPTQPGYFANNLRHVFRHMRKLDRRVDFFVQEVSEFPLGITAEIGRAMQPDGALVTAVGLDHWSEFRTVENVADEIGHLLAEISSSGVACLNADDPHVRSMAARTSGRIVLFGRSADAEVRAENLEASWPGGLRFDLVIGERRRRVVTRFVGTLLLPSVLGALAVMHAFDLDLDRAVADLAQIEPLGTRMRAIPGDDGHTYVVDTFKAPLWATRLLIEDIPNMSQGRRILVLGQVSDIGNDSSKKYRQLLRAASERCEMVIGVGEAASAAERLRRNEKRANVWPARDLHEVAGMLAAEPPALVVVKGNKLISYWSQLKATSPLALSSA
jgi:UDP-N-acetylmuramoyl-tripeptide--D-alanyl-D-alanine ligase